MVRTIDRFICDSLFDDGKKFIQPGEKEVWIKDTEIRGFYVREKPLGARIFFLRWRTKLEGNHTLTIGMFGSDMNCEQARTLAMEHRMALRKGDDPAAERRKKKSQSRTVEKAIEEFFELRAIPGINESSTIKEYRRLLAKAVPTLGSCRVGDLTFAQAQTLHASLKGTPREANNVLTVLRIFTNWCKRMGYRDARLPPITDGLSWFTENERKRSISGPELKRFLSALNRRHDAGAMPDNAYYVIWLMILTGARLNQILKLPWSQVEFENQILYLKPKNRRAKGRSAPKEDSRRLTGLVHAILKTLHDAREPEALWVFPADSKTGHLTTIQRQWRLLIEEARVKDLWRHDMRHHYGTEAMEMGIQPKVVSTMIGHSQVRTTTDRYQHPRPVILRQAQEKMSRRIIKKGAGMPSMTLRDKPPKPKKPKVVKPPSEVLPPALEVLDLNVEALKKEARANRRTKKRV
jgi:integrase